MPKPIIEFKNISKYFGKTVALDKISFKIYKGEIHSILGENGAGKTTLISILGGILKPDEGELFINQEKVERFSPQIAKKFKINTVLQHFSLIENLSVSENIVLQLKKDIDKKTKKQILSKANEFGIELDFDKKVYELTYSEKQWLEVFIKIYNTPNILILDEPTSSLSPIEGDKLLLKIKELSKRYNITVIFITHKLRELELLAEKITILKKGKYIKTISIRDYNPTEVTKLMIGEDKLQKETKTTLSSKKTEEVLNVNNLSYKNKFGKTILNNINFSLYKNEILGIIGISGNGQEELADILHGIIKPLTGKINILKNTRFIPADRLGVATIPEMKVKENLILNDFYKYPFSKNFFLKEKIIDEFTEMKIKEFNIKVNDKNEKLKNLSGGNIQKLILARELSYSDIILIAHNPTSGLDINSRAFIHNKLLEVLKKSYSIILISDDIDEVLYLSDRIGILFNGNLIGPYDKNYLNREKIGKLMLGEKVEI